jgi:hypothetical protein
VPGEHSREIVERLGLPLDDLVASGAVVVVDAP